MDDLINIILVILGATVGVIILSVVVWMLVYPISYLHTSNHCSDWGEAAERQTKHIHDFPWYNDCLVKTEQGWISGGKLNVTENDVKKDD